MIFNNKVNKCIFACRNWLENKLDKEVSERLKVENGDELGKIYIEITKNKNKFRFKKTQTKITLGTID